MVMSRIRRNMSIGINVSTLRVMGSLIFIMRNPAGSPGELKKKNTGQGFKVLSPWQNRTQ